MGFEQGVNFELMAGIDLSNQADVHYLFAYRSSETDHLWQSWLHHVVDTPSGVILNRKINPQAWKESRELSVPLARLSGDVALEQVDNGRHYLVEQPQGSGLFQEDCWVKLRGRSSSNVDRSMHGWTSRC